MRHRRVRIALIGLTLSVALFPGCARKKPPRASRLWLGPLGGCIETEPHPTTGTLACWGKNDAGQLGDGTAEVRTVATRSPLGESKITSLSLGVRHSCGVFERKTVRCWGDGQRGQLGTSVHASLSPMDVPTSTGPSEPSVGVGDAHSCMLDGEGHFRCFGANDEGQLGEANDWEVAGATVRLFALGAAHTCAEIRGERGDLRGVLCRGRAAAAPRDPVLVGTRVLGLVAGEAHTCGLLEGGGVACWGSNRAGELGDGSRTSSLAPVRVRGLANAVEIASGAHHTCARLREGTVVCWGDNRERQLAQPSVEQSDVPVSVTGLFGVREIAASGSGTCARLEGGAVRCWGGNAEGQLGDGTKGVHAVPSQLRFH
jgi:alpha-tubulin suppressor-like RCC1 family protein